MDSFKISKAEKLFYQDALRYFLKSSIGYLINLGLIILGAYIAFQYIKSIEFEEEVSGDE